ncbi:MAG: substrate-binding domain-containing protein [Treponema sp.]|jgi:ribose transport system substrate-binding protein|nr:substrate-binding domain-containing protein [Treponema sp.]
MKGKKIGMILFACIVCFGLVSNNLAARGQRGDSGEKKYTIMYISPMVAHPVWLIAKAGFDAAAAEFGFNGIWTGADDHSVEKTVEAMENAIVQRPDAMVICPFAPAAFTNALKKAREAGIVVTVSAVDAASEDLRAAFVGTDDVASGTEQVKQIINKLPKGQEVRIGIIMSNLDSENQVRQVNAAEQYMKSNGVPYKILDKQADFADANRCVEIVTNMVRAHPDMNAIMALEGGAAPAIGKAFEELGVGNKIVAVAMDGTDLNLETVRAGKITGVMAQNQFRWGYDTGKYAYLALKGEKVPSFTDSGVKFIDKSNVDTFDPMAK